ncbi:MAG: HNH endonuclease [Nitrosomonas sp.]|uniref:HNH endonuclease n=1 Tax=Nitrosomonas sp. TaxID=42353 RepID=UPI0025E6A534|nr:HNH endonuclease [Nitrosomonas sp.]MBY0473760.1 HNH endonuclease [Nitrosomonas sp.]
MKYGFLVTERIWQSQGELINENEFMSEITQEMLKKILRYDLSTGNFTWIATNKKAGCITEVSPGYFYVKIRIRNKKYYAHRLAFVYMTGEFPEEQVDHVNGDGIDNSWLNIRRVSSLENSRNHKLQINNKSGITGVLWSKKVSKWISMIYVNRKYIHLGAFKKLTQAVEARKKAEEKYSFHINHGRKRYSTVVNAPTALV